MAETAAPMHSFHTATIRQVATGQGGPPVEFLTTAAPQTVYVQPLSPHHPVYENFQSKQSGWLGATQITVGLGCLVFNAVGIGIQADMSFIGHGIWCGLFFILTGSLVISAGKSKSACTVIGSMVMCVISTVLCVIILSLSSFGASIAKADTTCGYFYYLYAPCQKSNVNAKIAMNGLLVTLALLEGFVAVWSAAICCGAACCGTPTHNGASIIQRDQSTMPAVQYLTGPAIPPNVVVISGGAHLGYHGQQQAAQLIVPPAPPMNVNVNGGLAAATGNGVGATVGGSETGVPPAYTAAAAAPPLYQHNSQPEETKQPL